MAKKKTKAYKKAKKSNKGLLVTILIVSAIVLVIALSITLSFLSGRHDGVKYKTYTEEDLQYKLPESFKATNYNYGEVEYADGEGGYFFFNSYDETELLEDQFLHADITPQEFAQTLITAWGIDSEYEYHPEDGSVTFDYNIDDAGEYYLHLIVRGSEHLFLFTLSCDTEDINEYASIFGYIFNNIVVK